MHDRWTTLRVYFAGFIYRGPITPDPLRDGHLIHVAHRRKIHDQHLAHLSLCVHIHFHPVQRVCVENEPSKPFCVFVLETAVCFLARA